MGSKSMGIQSNAWRITLIFTLKVLRHVLYWSALRMFPFQRVQHAPRLKLNHPMLSRLLDFRRKGHTALFESVSGDKLQKQILSMQPPDSQTRLIIFGD